MTTAEARTESHVIAEKLQKHHGEKLGVHEQFEAAVRGGSVNRVQPGAVFSVLGSLGRRMQQSLGEDAVQRRIQQVKTIMHRKGLKMVHFDATKVGYTVALTDRRVLVFNYTGRGFVSQSKLRDLRLETVTHDNGMTTLLFCEGRECAAITCWDDAEDVESFVAAFNRLKKANAGI